jgi:hypothetical protein
LAKWHPFTCNNFDDTSAHTPVNCLAPFPACHYPCRQPRRISPPHEDAMTNTRFDKSKLPSRHVTEGPARAPHRSYFYAMGITEDEIHQPWVGVATCWN